MDNIGCSRMDNIRMYKEINNLRFIYLLFDVEEYPFG